MVFGGGAATWVQMQAAYDLAQALERSEPIELDRIAPEASA
jgi:plasmid maintenance system antidote protein VapI